LRLRRSVPGALKDGDRQCGKRRGGRSDAARACVRVTARHTACACESAELAACRVCECECGYRKSNDSSTTAFAATFIAGRRVELELGLRPVPRTLP
jgi:hypothetical protein